MRRFVAFAAMCAFVAMAISSCSPRWYCYVDSVGAAPSDKTYYSVPYFPQDVNPLVASQFMADLDVVMTKAGYVKADSLSASLKVYFAYRLGDMHEKINQTSRPVFQTGLQPTYYGYETQTVYAGQETTFSSETVQDFEMRIDAYNIKTEKPVFSVYIADSPRVYVTHDLRKYMPLYLLSAMPYLGKATVSLTGERININDERQKWFMMNAPLE